MYKQSIVDFYFCRGLLQLHFVQLGFSNETEGKYENTIAESKNGRIRKCVS